jgi:hypothetical protein
MKVHNFFGPNIVTSFLVEVVMVIVINVVHTTASASTEAIAATIANYPPYPRRSQPVHDRSEGQNVEKIQDDFPVVTRPAEVPHLQFSHLISQGVEPMEPATVCLGKNKL